MQAFKLPSITQLSSKAAQLISFYLPKHLNKILSEAEINSCSTRYKLQLRSLLKKKHIVLRGFPAFRILTSE